jgi:hypothetical protein
MTIKQRKIEEWKKQLRKVAERRETENVKFVFDKDIIEGADEWEPPLYDSQFQTLRSPSLKALKSALKKIKTNGGGYILRYVLDYTQKVKPYDFSRTPITPPERSFTFVGKILTL